jgi:Apea-like HEPN
MAKTRAKLKSDDEFRKLVEAFCNVATSAACKTNDDVKAALSSGAGLKMISGRVFAGSKELWEGIANIQKRAVKLVGESICHEKDVEEAIWVSLLESDCKAADMVGRLTDQIMIPIEVRSTFAISNYAVKLEKGIEEFTIGPVGVRRTPLIAEKFNQSASPFRVRISGSTPTPDDEKKIDISLLPLCWEIEVSATRGLVANQAKILADVALSLLRIAIFATKNGGHAQTHFPFAGDLEAHPFRKLEIDQNYIRKSPTGLSVGGSSLSHHYVVDQAIVKAILKKEFVDRTRNLFGAADGSIGERVFRGLGWLARARQTEDVAERFLYCFTALEALLTSDDKSAPVVERIARRAATILEQEPRKRKIIFKRIKELYAKRSALVHSGTRKVSHADTRILESILDNIYIRVFENVDMKVKFENFEVSVDDAGFGQSWPMNDE